MMKYATGHEAKFYIRKTGQITFKNKSSLTVKHSFLCHLRGIDKIGEIPSCLTCLLVLLFTPPFAVYTWLKRNKTCECINVENIITYFLSQMFYKLTHGYKT